MDIIAAIFLFQLLYNTAIRIAKGSSYFLMQPLANNKAIVFQIDESIGHFYKCMHIV